MFVIGCIVCGIGLLSWALNCCYEVLGSVRCTTDGCVINCYEVLGSVRCTTDGCVIKCYEVLGGVAYGIWVCHEMI